jgi:outer membrane protein assembly factor BamB
MAVDARTGAIRWNTVIPRILPDSDTGASFVALWQNLVLVSAMSGRIFAIDRGSGAILWSVPGVGTRPPSSISPNAPMPSDVRAIVVVGTRLLASSEAGWFVTYDLATHLEISRSDPKIEGSQDGRIVSDGKSIYVVYLTGAVVVFSATEGSPASMAGRAGGPLIIQVALGSDRFFVPGDDGFYAYAK